MKKSPKTANNRNNPRIYCSSVLNSYFYIIRQEKINIRSLRSKAKFFGTIICVTGAISMVLLKGPKLLNKEFHSDPIHSILRLSKGGETWLLGCLLLFASNCCWSIWLILQVYKFEHCWDHIMWKSLKHVISSHRHRCPRAILIIYL